MSYSASGAILGANQTTVTDPTKSETSRNTLAKNFDTFLIMLTTQLKNQDPLSPMDSTEFTNQLVQFANVEQQINVNSNLETMIKLQQVNQNSMALGYIGHTIEANSSLLPLQDGKGRFSYTLPEDAENLTIVIKNDKGDVIANLTDLKSTAGRHEMTWDGKDLDGKQMADGGLYIIEIAATNTKGEQITASSTVYGRVTDISADGTDTLLNMSGVVVSIEKVLTVRDTASLDKGNGPGKDPDGDTETDTDTNNGSDTDTTVEQSASEGSDDQTSGS